MYKEDAGQPAGRSGGGGTSGGGSSNMDAPPVAENAEQPKFSEIKQPGNDTLKWSDLPETMRYYTCGVGTKCSFKPDPTMVRFGHPVAHSNQLEGCPNQTYSSVQTRPN